MPEPQTELNNQPSATPSRAVWTWCALGWLLTGLVVIALYNWWVRPDLRLWRGMLTHGDPMGKAVALTFDDGPHPLWAPLLADTLSRHGARGTFFVVGMEAQLYPEITARLARSGHEVAMHSLTHPYPNLTIFPRTRVEKEITGVAAILQQITRQPQRDFRPPGGGLNDTLIALLKAKDMRLAWWSANAGDWSSPAPVTIAQRIHEELHAGDVLLLHERENTAAALERYFAVKPEPFEYNTFTEVTRQELWQSKTTTPY